ncbi:MAG: multicopper oxidase domain-containing protein [Planctomycetaceae bacterium]
MRRNFRARLVATTDLLKVVVTGPPVNMDWPSDAAHRAAAAFTPEDVPRDNQLSGNWTLQFKDASTPTERKFLINDKAYSGLVERAIPLETAEEWRIEAAAGGHPFHVHVNPFAVREMNGSGIVRWRWQDTLFVAHEEHAIVRSWFRTHPGQTVLHCHILDHEDLGMMQLIKFTTPPGMAGAGDEVRTISLQETTRWSLKSPTGEPIRPESFLGQPLLLVLHRGLGCAHCSRQIALLAERQLEFTAIGVQLAAVCPELPSPPALAAARAQFRIDFSLLADADLQLFRQSGCVDRDGNPLHGLLLFDAGGELAWRHASNEPLLDIQQLLTTIRRELGKTGADVTADVATP